MGWLCRKRKGERTSAPCWKWRLRRFPRFSYLLNRRVDHSLMLPAPYAAFVSHGLAAVDRSALRVNVARIAGDESTAAARPSAFGRHRPSHTPGMSWMSIL